jgi:hypothetical protein
MADSSERDFISYQTRSAWYLRHFGEEYSFYQSEMEDGQTALAVMEFFPRLKHTPRRSFWTYATNGMSERRMPEQGTPRGRRQPRLEVLAYTRDEATWIVRLLEVFANYPFVHSTRLGVGFTLPVTKSYRKLWAGYLLIPPVNEAKDFTPLTFDATILPDPIGFVQLVGLTKEEMYLVAKEGGMELVERLVAVARKSFRLFLDVPPDVSLAEGEEE